MFKIFPITFCFISILVLSACNAKSDPAEGWISKFDERMQRKLEENKIPGMAVALVEGNETVLAKGYGLRNVESNLAVDENTLFHIASTHKSISSMLIATLVDGGVVGWNTPVIDYYPRFQLSSDSSTNTVTLSHLLSMSSGIPANAEDVLTDDATTNDVFLAAKQSTLLGAPLDSFSYSNISVSLAGYIGVIASNGDDQNLIDDYARLLQSKVLDPIGMSRSTIYASEAEMDGNLSRAYGLFNSGEPVYEESEDTDSDVLAPSGSLKSSAKEMALFVSTQLNQGVAPNQNRVVSAVNLIKTRQTVLDNYAMGWARSSYNNTEVIMHTGSYDGFVSVLVLIPSFDVGLVLLANSEDAAEDLTEHAHELLIDELLNDNTITAPESEKK